MLLLGVIPSIAFPSHLECKSKPLQCLIRLDMIDFNNLSDIISFHCLPNLLCSSHTSLLAVPRICCFWLRPLPLLAFFRKHFLQMYTKLAFSFLLSLFISKAILNIIHSNHPSLPQPGTHCPTSLPFYFFSGTYQHLTYYGFTCLFIRM